MAGGCPGLARFTADSRRLYELLGIDGSASDEDIRKAYRRQARRLHPDKGGDPEAFRAVQRAYEVLGDAGKRARYDEFGEDGLKESFHVAESQVPAECPADETAERRGGGLAVGTCLLTAAASSMCGASAAAGVALCGVGQALRDLGGRHRAGAAVAAACGLLLLWPWVAPVQGWSGTLWALLMYAAVAAGLAALGAQRAALPAFLPYLLFAGYMLLFLLMPTKTSQQVLLELPGYVLLEEEGEVASDSAFAESAALFTWGVVGIHMVLSRARAGRPPRACGGDDVRV